MEFSKEEVAVWLIEHKSHILSGILVAGLALVVGLKTTMKSDKHEADYMAARNEFAKWTSSKDEESFDRLTKLLQEYPELKPRYESKIVQQLIGDGEGALAQDLAKDVLERSRGFLPLHEKYARVSLLIQDEQLLEALSQSLALKEALKEEKGSATLIGFNLYRIAMLYQKLGQFQEELTVWDALLDHLESAEMALKKFFSEGNLSLEEYIEMRKRVE